MKIIERLRRIFLVILLLVSIQVFSQDTLDSQKWWLPSAFGTCRDIYDNSTQNLHQFYLDSFCLYYDLANGDTITDYMQRYSCDSTVRMSGLVRINSAPIFDSMYSYRIIDVATNNVITSLHKPEPTNVGNAYQGSLTTPRMCEYMFDSIITLTDDFFIAFWLPSPYYNAEGSNSYMGFVTLAYRKLQPSPVACNSGVAAMLRYSNGTTMPILQKMFNVGADVGLQELGIDKTYYCDLGLFPIFAEEDSISSGGNSALPSVEVEKYMSVFPNPASETLNVGCSYKIQSYAVLNSLGQELISEKANANTLNINLAGLKSGVYFIKIHTSKGTATKRFVVQ